MFLSFARDMRYLTRANTGQIIEHYIDPTESSETSAGREDLPLAHGGRRRHVCFKTDEGNTADYLFAVKYTGVGYLR